MAAMRALPAAAQCPRERALLAGDDVECVADGFVVAASECETRGGDACCERFGKLRGELLREEIGIRARARLTRVVGIACFAESRHRGELCADERELEARAGFLL